MKKIDKDNIPFIRVVPKKPLSDFRTVPRPRTAPKIIKVKRPLSSCGKAGPMMPGMGEYTLSDSSISDKAFISWFTNVIRKWEGGTAERNPKDDPGGLTTHGVTIKYWQDKAHKIIGAPPTREALMKISWDDAKKIAYQDFWLGKKINTIKNAAFRPFVADTYWLGGGINSLGYPTITALNNAKLESVQGLYNKRLAWLKKLSNWEANKNGWTNRMNSVLATAKSLGGNKKVVYIIGGLAVASALGGAYYYYGYKKNKLPWA